MPIMSTKVRRLFRQFQPSHYDLTLHIDPEAMVFSGKVVIDGRKVDRPSERLTFHQSGLTITSAKICFHDKRGDKDITIKRINKQKSFDEVRLHADNMLYPGRYTVTLEFDAKITRPMNGIYPSYFEHNGEQKKLISTQFESHHAREAFPCIDEPEAKATFDLTLISPAIQTVIANTPIKEQIAFASQAGSLAANNAKAATTITTPVFQQTTFETTPKMSTYLLAFVTGEMGYLEATTKDGVLVRTYATPDNVKHTQFALDTAVKCLEFYNDYFDIPYPLAKCDFIALPDFASGAMENWGCITFREQTLLVDNENTSLSMKQYVAMVVAHELAHQWFGNLVTMQWWNDLWLNESFASWIEYLATDKLHPEWNMWTQFAVDEQQPALKLDALEHTHPIEVTINHPDEIRTIFDTISYSKGASVLNMLYVYVGADDFRDGLRLYLQQHAYGNTVTTDLWAALEQASQLPVKNFMAAWTSQAGFPLLQADVTGEQVTFSQSRFYLNPATKKVPITDSKATEHSVGTTDTTEVWPIPFNASIDLPKASLREQTQTFQLGNLPNTSLLLLNKDRSGFYQTLYNPSHLVRLGEAIRGGHLEPVTRLALLSDTFSAAKAGYIGTSDALKLLKSYACEDNSVVWDIIAMNISDIRGVMDDDGLRQDLKPFVRKLVAGQLARLGWQTIAAEGKVEPHFDSLLRPLILGMASSGEDPTVVAEAMKRFEAMTRPEDIEPDIRGIIYGTAARIGSENGSKKEFEKLLHLHNISTSSEERVTLAGALTAFKQPELIEQTLAMITSDKVRLQDAGYWIGYSFGNRHAKRRTWQWMIDNWQWLETNLGSNMSYSRMPYYAARVFSDESFLSEFEAFFGPKAKQPVFERPVAQAIETIQWQSAWRKRDLASIKAFFGA